MGEQLVAKDESVSLDQLCLDIATENIEQNTEKIY